MKEYLFVYGLLRRNVPHAMASFLEAHTRYMGKGYFLGYLFDVGDYPAAIKDVHGNKVLGDILQITDLAVFNRLDIFEEVGEGFKEPNEYIRVKIPVFTEKNEPVDCWIYLYNWPVKGMNLIIEGDYLVYLQQKNK